MKKAEIELADVKDSYETHKKASGAFVQSVILMTNIEIVGICRYSREDQVKIRKRNQFTPRTTCRRESQSKSFHRHQIIVNLFICSPHQAKEALLNYQEEVEKINAQVDKSLEVYVSSLEKEVQAAKEDLNAALAERDEFKFASSSFSCSHFYLTNCNLQGAVEKC